MALSLGDQDPLFSPAADEDHGLLPGCGKQGWFPVREPTRLRPHSFPQTTAGQASKTAT
jgi:hypothetical protein